MRRLPKSVKVLGQRVEVRTSEAIEHGEYGTCDGMFYPGIRTIEVATRLSPDKQRDVALHESLHAMLTVSRLDDYLGPTFDEEATVKGLAPVLLQFIRENKAFIAYLQEAE